MHPCLSLFCQNYEWIIVPWLIYQFFNALLMIISPSILIYTAFDILAQNEILWITIIPTILGLLGFYFWIHVKIYFDQLTKATKKVAPKPDPLKDPPNVQQNPVSITVMAPYPPFDKNYSIFDHGGVTPRYEQPLSTMPEIMAVKSKPLTPVTVSHISDSNENTSEVIKKAE